MNDSYSLQDKATETLLLWLVNLRLTVLCMPIDHPDLTFAFCCRQHSVLALMHYNPIYEVLGGLGYCFSTWDTVKAIRVRCQILNVYKVNNLT